METFLEPIEKPKRIMMKLAYFFTRIRFGKVLTPLKVHSVRLPLAFGRFYNRISRLDKKLKLPSDLALIIRQQVARLNECLFCIDIGRYEAIKKANLTRKFDALDHYKTNYQFTEGERAALDYATELTRDKRVNPAVFEKLRIFFSERQICEIVWLVASEHVYNMTNIGLNIHSDMLCELPKVHKVEDKSSKYNVAS